MKMQIIREELLNQLKHVSSTAKALIGLDGYVDKIQHPVQAENTEGSVYFSTLDSFGQHVKDAAGKSAQVELYSQVIKLGGNAPILAHALAALGIKNTCLGTFGESRIEEVFQTIHPDCTLISLGKPAETNALEFTDGKLILSELSAFDNLDWHCVKSKIGVEKLLQISQEVALIALVDWCNLPHATNIWRGVLEDLLQIENSTPPKVFFDLADPTKKSDNQIMEVIDLINSYGAITEVALGLNENETIKLYKAFCRSKGAAPNLDDLIKIGQYLYAEMDITYLLVHPIDCSYLFSKENPLYLKGKLVKKPTVSTGGGDNFNAGFCFGWLNGFSMATSMKLAMATSGAYVQNGKSPNLEAIKAYLYDS